MGTACVDARVELGLDKADGEEVCVEVFVPATGGILEAVDGLLESPHVAIFFETGGGLQVYDGVKAGIEVGGVDVEMAQVELEGDSDEGCCEGS